MIDKKEFLLEQIIKAYITNLEPIGSSQLKSMYDIAYSSATIRGYFKKLGDEGFLAQEHISSGRTPTTEALKQYWTNKLSFRLNFVDIKKVESLAHQIGLCVFLKTNSDDVLKSVLQIDEKHIILEFSTFTEVVKYSDALYRFLSGLVEFDVQHIQNISKQVGAFEIYEKIGSYLQNRDFEIFNIKEFLSLGLNYNYDDSTIQHFLSGRFLEKCEEGLYFEKFFPHNYIGVCHNISTNLKSSKLFVLGELNKDYEYFYNQIQLEYV